MTCKFLKLLVATMLFSFALNSKVSGQIEAPVLLCIDNDTLIWETPVNSCGSFRGYIIQGSQSLNGPFTPVDTIFDQAQSNYFHVEAGGSTWYYYLESDFDCPGLTRLSSDTLDNLIPEIAPLQSASVQGNQVILNWAASVSPETYAYIISRNTSSGTTIIDTVFSQTTYTDNDASPTTQVETYFVTALDRCGNTSLVTMPHSTMFLSLADISECDQTVSFNWTPYQGWENPVEKYEIWVSVNGAAPVLNGSVGGNTTSYVFENANDKEEYCFTINAIESGTGNSAFSNSFCQVTDITQPIRELSIRQLTYDDLDNSRISLNWTWNTNAQLEQALILRSTDNANFELVNSIDLTSPLQQNNSFVDANPPSSETPICYRIETTDACGDVAISNLACTIHLTAETDGQGANRLNWTPFDLGQAISLSYEVYRIENGVPVLVDLLNGNETSLDDTVDPGQNSSGTLCYYVEANAEILWPDGSSSLAVSRSNTACTQQSSGIYIPNAFAPDGANTEFRPYLQFGAPAAYLLEIYDRWGNKVFQSASIDQAWDGTKDGQNMPTGVYIYRLLITQENGTQIERSGSVALIR